MVENNYLEEIREKAKVRTDISDHLETLYNLVLDNQPRLIVELGIRGGESSFAIRRAAKLCNSKIIGVDIDDCSNVYKDDLNIDSGFIKGNDVSVASCFHHYTPLGIDFLFIDTSHFYEHTVEEIKAWFPLLNDRCVVVFHDTNLKPIMYHKDGTVWDKGWDNHRGVIRAIEEYFNTKIDETLPQNMTIGTEWSLTHLPYNSGLTILKREIVAGDFEGDYFKDRKFEDKYYYMAQEWLSLTKPKTVFDYGCGEGFFVHAFNYLGVESYGYDISRYAINHAYGLSKDKIFNKLLLGKEYDLVICSDVLEHIEPQLEDEIINDICFLSTKYIILSVCDITLKYRYQDKTHCNLRTKQYWIDKFERRGWKSLNIPNDWLFKEQLYLFKKVK